MAGQLRLLNPLRAVVATLAGGIALMGVLSWFGALHWTFELLSHFRFYYFVLGGILALLALALRLTGPAVVVALVATVNGAAAWPHMAVPVSAARTEPLPVVRVLWANLHNWATDLGALRELIEREKPDIAVFTELAGTHAETVRQMRALLPYQSTLPDGNPLDVMLLSKRPPEALHFDLEAGGGAPLLMARICPGEAACLTLLALHASRPFPHAGGLRDRQLAYAATVARREVDAGHRVVFVGDLNVTPFSPVYDRLLGASGLADTASIRVERARSATATWWFGNTGIGLPIDHVLVGPGVMLVERRLGTPIRSDHLPLIVDLRIAP